MRFILVTAGSFGDVVPFVNIGAELQRRGHEVKIVASGYFQALCDRNALTLCAYSNKEDYQNVLDDPRLVDGRKSAKTFAQKVLLPAIRPVYEIILQHYIPGETVLLSTGFCFGARIASEKFNIPLATVKLAPVQFRSLSDLPKHPLFKSWLPDWWPRSIWYLYDKLMVDPLIKSAINEVRSSIGLSPAHRILHKWYESPEKVFGLVPEWFMRMDKHWPAHSELVGFPLPALNQQVLDSDIESFLDRHPNPMIFTGGTANKKAKSFFYEAVTIAEQLEKPAILLTLHKDMLPKTLPAYVRHVDFSPLGVLLARASILIHPGGIGTISEAIRAGIPQVIVPVANDQFDNGNRIEAFGLGVCIKRKHFLADAMVPKVKTALQSLEIRNLCAHRSRMLQSNNLVYIGDRIEAYVKNIECIAKCADSPDAGDATSATIAAAN
ncbi:glycosyltransferase family 1 protein [Exilibacterium tricleocarpae]|uniref:Glycosyltransferase family 1 protein n=1 Tax=Exilibacterium tricleocarpae TaxID=2591008 RepID=A0A545SNH1_9GAMM|nr:glycosyltransferase [Exilibacterium tricleocarpae]TQV66511.1 glycosyltransferase family 1 protein [Exilibacterium tricleocarpae]